jgi:hypothetical protein
MNLKHKSNSYYTLNDFYQSPYKRFTLTVRSKKSLFGEKFMSKRTDVYAIQNDLAAAVGRRNEIISTILDLTAELREAKRIATQLEKSPSKRFQEGRDAGKVDVFAELAKQ